MPHIVEVTGPVAAIFIFHLPGERKSEVSYKVEKVKDTWLFLSLAQSTFHLYLDANDVAPIVVEPWIYLGQQDLEPGVHCSKEV